MKRNQDRFPTDFAFQLTREEWDDLLCQSGISSSYSGRRTPPFVFTEQGVAMLSGVLRSERREQIRRQPVMQPPVERDRPVSSCCTYVAGPGHQISPYGQT